MLESVIPTESGIVISGSEAAVDFKVKVTPRVGKTPSGGKLYFKLTSTYAGSADVAFNGTVKPNGAGVFAAYPTGMPYVAGTHGDGLEYTYAVAELTPTGTTLRIEVLGDGAAITKSAVLEFIQAISVEYAWVDETV